MLRSVLADNKSVSPSCVERVHPDVADGGDDGSRTDARTAVAADAAATTLQLDAVAARTEGFVARDLKRLTERAVWHHLMTKSGLWHTLGQSVHFVDTLIAREITYKRLDSCLLVLRGNSRRHMHVAGALVHQDITCCICGISI